MTLFMIPTFLTHSSKDGSGSNHRSPSLLVSFFVSIMFQSGSMMYSRLTSIEDGRTTPLICYDLESKLLIQHKLVYRYRTLPVPHPTGTVPYRYRTLPTPIVTVSGPVVSLLDQSILLLRNRTSRISDICPFYCLLS